MNATGNPNDSAIRGAGAEIAEAISERLINFTDCFISPIKDEPDKHEVNLTDGLFAIARALVRIAEALEEENKIAAYAAAAEADKEAT
jgi:hypothetical protein